jgi:hypothetical protein
MALSEAVLAKWPREILDEGFVPFPKRLIRAAGPLFKGPTAIELLVTVLSVVDFKRPDASRLPSLGALAYTAGLPVEVFRDRLNQLVLLGYAEVRGGDEAIDVTLYGLVRALLAQSNELSAGADAAAGNEKGSPNTIEPQVAKGARMITLEED